MAHAMVMKHVFSDLDRWKPSAFDGIAALLYARVCKDLTRHIASRHHARLSIFVNAVLNDRSRVPERIDNVKRIRQLLNRQREAHVAQQRRGKLTFLLRLDLERIPID